MKNGELIARVKHEHLRLALQATRRRRDDSANIVDPPSAFLFFRCTDRFSVWWEDPDWRHSVLNLRLQMATGGH